MNVFKKLAIFAAIIVFSASMAYAGLMDRSSKCGFDIGSYIYGPEISASPGAPTGSNWRMYVVADVPYFISDGQAAISMIDSGTTALDDIDDPDANTTIDATTYYTVFTGADTDKHNWQFESTGVLTDFAVVSITQKTGDATDGKLLYATSGDDDVDGIVVYNSTAALGNANTLLTLDFADDDDTNGTYILCRDDERADTVFKVGQGGDVTISETLLIDEDSMTFTAAGSIIAGASSAITLDAGGGNAAGEDLVITAQNMALTATGALSFAPDVAVTTCIDASDSNYTNALSIGANIITGTYFTVAADGDVDCVDLDASGNVDITGTLAVTGGISQDAFVATGTATTLTVDGSTTGGVTIGGISEGTITLGAAAGAAATEVNLPSTVDLVLAGGDLTITDTANADLVQLTNNTVTGHDIMQISATGTRTAGNIIKITDGASTGGTIAITANTQTSGNGISYTNTGAGLTGAAVYLSLTDGAYTGDFLTCYNGSGDIFTIKRYGATTIAGLADSDMLTITAGDVQITDGYIDIDDGYIDVDTNEDHSTSFTRDLATAATAACVLIDDTNPAGTTAKPALEINQDCTGNSTGIKISHDGDYPVIDIDAGAARTGNVIDITMDNQEAERVINIDCDDWTGTASEGVIHIVSDADTNIPVGTFLFLDQNGTGQHAAAIGGSVIYVADAATEPAAGTSYAMYIDATNIEALNVATGKALFAEMATFTLGIDSNAAVDIDLATNANLVDINHAAELAADGAVVTIAETDATVETNNMFLMRLAYTDAHEKCDYMVFEDGTGDQLQIGAVGDIVMGGADGTGGKLVTSFEDLTATSAGVAASIVVYTSFVTTNGDADEDAITLANGTKGQIKVFVSSVETAGGDSYKITPATLNGGSKITFDGVVGDGCTMMFDGTAWNIISNNGGSIS